MLRPARPSKHGPLLTSSPQQTGQLRAEALQQLGLNLNDYWTLRSGSIANAIPAPAISQKTEAERANRYTATDKADAKRLQAELRLQERMSLPHGDGDVRGTHRSSARASARLSAALAEARRLGCRSPHLLRQAEALLLLLERAATEQHARERSSRAGADGELERRAVLVQRLAHHRFIGAARATRAARASRPRSTSRHPPMEHSMSSHYHG